MHFTVPVALDKIALAVHRAALLLDLNAVFQVFSSHPLLLLRMTVKRLGGSDKLTS